MATANAAATASRRQAPDLFQPIWRLLTSVRFAVLYISVLAGVGLMGVVIPQVPEPMRGNDAAIDAWLAHERGTFGPFTDPMHRLGLFEVFHARWFLFALAFLVLNVTTCTVNRWSPTFRNVFNPPKRVPEPFFAHAHNRTTLAAVEPEHAESALRRLRFRVRRETQGGATYLFADRYPWAQLATFISHLALILFIAGGLVTRLTGFSAEIFSGEGTTSPIFAVSNPNQLQVRIDDAVGAFGDKGNPLDFRTHLTIFKNGQQVASGFTTVNDPLKYGGYRFHQVAYFPDGAALRIRDLATGNTVVHETFPLQETTAAPSVTITDASGNVLLNDVLPPTDFLSAASGGLVSVPGTDRVLWIGLTAKDQQAWQLAVFDPKSSPATSPQDAQARIDEGASAPVGALTVRFDRVVSLPSAVGIVPSGAQAAGPDADKLLAELSHASDGRPLLQLVGPGRPALLLAPDQPVQAGGYEYTFEGTREFAGIAVKRDHGATFIWVATAMLLGGLAITFYVPRRRLWLKLTGEATHVAALAEKSGGFERDMRILARRLGVQIPPELQEEP
ncbi:MAG TPA: cytochrome c biogenesis protein ResB [Dehalococcoidia bacterium]|nr:cytochrome c biogenesis protein ResB [Dehalococcoidia bacterium]